MNLLRLRTCCLPLLVASVLTRAFALEPTLPSPIGIGGGGNDAGAQHSKILEFPADLIKFRSHALEADGQFAPDIAFSLRTCPKCRNQYVFGIYPRLSRAPYDDLAAVHRSIEESLRKPAPRSMFSVQSGKQVPRACPYCNEPERDARANRAYFCHYLPETGDDLHIEYTVKDGKAAERVFWRIPRDGAPVNTALSGEDESTFKAAYGCHFSIRAVWNEIFAKHWDDATVFYENMAPGLWLIFRPSKVSDADFKDFAAKKLVPDRDKGLFTRLESVLKIDKNLKDINTYVQWSPAFAEKLSTGTAECFVGISLPELRSSAVAAVQSRKATLTIPPVKPTVPGAGNMERGPLKLPVNLAPLVRLCALGGLSIQQTCSQYLGEGSYSLDAAERLGRAVQKALPECEFSFEDGHIMIARDKDKQERRVDLLALGGKLDADDPVVFGLYRDNMLRWDAKKGHFGNAPIEREISPVGLPAFIERRIRPADHMAKRNAPGALFEPYFDTDGRRCDLAYTSECLSTVVFVDPTKPRFKDIPDVSAARRLYAAEGGLLPVYIEAQDVLKFPGGIPGLLECRVAILYGSDISSLASEPERASALADYGDVPEDTKRVNLYAFTTNCAAIAPRKLTIDERELLASRVKDFLKSASVDPGLELNLHFDLPRSQGKGKVLRRKK